ncbi:MAG: diguanylate cyclase [Lachnospiraceae bacterium]|nr:diguanylate cyclase [Lachnospiraceae bacterium]
MLLFLFALTVVLSAVELIWLLLNVKRADSYYVLFYATITVSCLGYLSVAVSQSVSEAILGTKIIYITGVLLPILMLYTIADLCKASLHKIVYILLGAFGLVTAGCSMTIGYLPVYYSEVAIERFKSITILVRSYGPLHIIYPIFLLVDFLAFMIVIIQAFRKSHKVSRAVVITLVAEFAIAATVYFLEHIFNSRVEFMPFVYILLGYMHLNIIMQQYIYDISRGLTDHTDAISKNGYLAFDKDLRLMNCNDLPIEIFPELNLIQFGSNFYKMTTEFYKTIYLWVNNLTLNFDQKPHTMQFVKDNRVFKCNIVQLKGFRNKELGFMMEIIDDTENNEKILSLEAENKSLDQSARTDAMTGLLNKAATEGDIGKAMGPDVHGTFLMLDLDSFKLVNDMHGHDAGDKVLIKFSELMREISRPDDILGRIGGDEFVIYYRGWQTEESLQRNTAQLNEKLLSYAKELLGEDMNVPLGCSVGAVFIPQCGFEYNEIKKKADKALYNVKQNGKHGVYIIKESDESEKSKEISADIRHLQGIRQSLSERNNLPGPLEVSFDDVKAVYRYLARYYESAASVGGMILFRLEGDFTEDDSDTFWEVLHKSLRREDLITKQQSGVFLTILADTQYEDAEVVVGKIFNAWDELDGELPEVTAEVQGI